MMQQLPNMHQGPTDARDWTPHLSQPCSNCIVGSLLPNRCLSAAQTKLVLMKPSDEVAITDFCRCHRGQPWRRRGWRRISRPRGFLHARCVTLDGRKAKLLSEATGEQELDQRFTLSDCWKGSEASLRLETSLS